MSRKKTVTDVFNRYIHWSITVEGIRGSSSDERINRLRNPIETLDDDDSRRDKANVMNISSQEFTRHMKGRGECTRNNDLRGAEAHKLIAESIHRTLTTFEAIKEWFVPNNKLLNNRWGQRSSRMDRETRLNSLRLKLGRDLVEDEKGRVRVEGMVSSWLWTGNDTYRGIRYPTGARGNRISQGFGLDDP